MLIKLLKNTELEDGKHKKGEVINPIFEIANQLIATEFAVEYNDLVAESPPESLVEEKSEEANAD